LDRPAWIDQVPVVSGHSDLRLADCYLTKVIEFPEIGL
jgi:hypothetical protein